MHQHVADTCANAVSTDGCKRTRASPSRGRVLCFRRTRMFWVKASSAVNKKRQRCLAPSWLACVASVAAGEEWRRAHPIAAPPPEFFVRGLIGTWRFITIRVAGAVLVNLWALLTPVRGRAARTPPWRASQSTCRCSDSWRGWSAGQLGHTEKAPKRGVADAVLTVRTGGTRRRAQRGPQPPWPCPAVRPAWAWSHLAVPPPTVQGRGGASPRGTTAVGHPPLVDTGAVGGGGGAWSRE